MIDPHTPSTIQTSDALTSTQFSIETNASMFKMLTSKIYNDPLLAVMREWSTNAIDACKDAKLEVNFDVHLPTADNLTFSVRDYGTGLPKDQITTLFCTMGASTKRDSNEFNGAFGIGRLAGLAYTDSFTIESFYNGSYFSYLVTTDSGTPTAVELASSTTTEPNGLKLSVAVADLNDASTFSTTARSLYKHFAIKPNLNLDIDVSSNISMDISADWFIDQSMSWDNYVLMSDVIYRIPSSSDLDAQGFRHLVLRCPTGSVSINPGREALSMDKPTVAYLNSRFQQASDDFVDFSLEAIKDLPTPIEQINLLQATISTAPGNLDQALTARAFSTIPAFDEYLTKSRGWSANLEFTPKDPNITFKLCTTNYKTLRPISELHLRDLSTTSFLVIDLKTNWRHCLDDFTSAIVLTRPTGTTMEEFLPAAEQWLEDLGITSFHRASEYATTEAIKAKAIRTGVYVSHPSYASFGQATKCSPDSSYIYVPLSGTTYNHPTVPEELFYHLLKYYPLPSSTYFVGVPKKYLDLASQNDSFTPLEDFLASTIAPGTFYASSSMDFSTNLERYNSIRELTTPVPQLVLDYISEHEAYQSFFPADLDKFYRLGPTALKLFTDYFPDLDVRHFPHVTSDEAVFAAFPLLSSFYGRNDSANLAHYLELEYHYHDLHQASDLSDPSA